MLNLNQVKNIGGQHDLVLVGHGLDAGHDLLFVELCLGADVLADVVDGNLLNVLLLKDGEECRLEFG